MIDSLSDNKKYLRKKRLKGRQWQPFTDIHCHCLPGLDDGPATMTESLELCWRLAEEGIAKVVATPHQLGRFDGRNDAARVRESVCNLNESLQDSNVPLEVVPGGEVRLDERLCELLDADKILTIADGGRFILLELPFNVFIDIEPMLMNLASMGIQCVIAHAEMNIPLSERPQVLRRWLEHSVYVQITASSLVGDFGPEAERTAWGLLSSRWATIVATDSHDTDFRRPRMRAAFQDISEKLGEDVAHLVCIENPLRVVKGQDMQPVLSNDQQKVER